jgi:hypothetical protein
MKERGKTNMENKIIGGISLDKWKEALGKAAAIAMDKDYFSDILFFELYPNIAEETAKIDEEDEEAICDIYNAKWEYADEAFKEVFGFSRYE